MQRLPFPTHKLAGRAVIAVAGEEAQHFLQNLVTADIDSLKPGQAVYSATVARLIRCPRLLSRSRILV